MSKRNTPWPFNPLSTLIRLHGIETITDTIDRYETEHHYKANAFDLAIQVMIVACSYAPKDVWHSNNSDVAIAAEYIAKGAASDALEVLEYSIEQGDIWLNTDLIQTIATQQIKRLHRLFAAHQSKFDLPTYDDKALSGFVSGAELKGLRFADIRADGDVCDAVATEKISGQNVVFRPVDLALSRAYAETFHYLHSGRHDDTLAFGAFLENEAAPFALVSYAPIGRRYKQKLLQIVGIDHNQSLELTRAWNSDDSPKNTMSMLFAYAHANIQRLWFKENGAHLEAVLTDINPNLGFKGSAFRAVGFGHIGDKPTSYRYTVGTDGEKSYVLRRDLDALLSRSAPNQVAYVTSAFPLLSTKELAVILNGSQRSRPTHSIYRVNEEDFRNEAQTL